MTNNLSLGMKFSLFFLAMAGFFITELVTLKVLKRKISLWRIIYSFTYGFCIEGMVFVIAITNSDILSYLWIAMVCVSFIPAVIAILYGVLNAIHKNSSKPLRTTAFYIYPSLICFAIMFIGQYAAASFGVIIPTLMMYTVAFIFWGFVSAFAAPDRF